MASTAAANIRTDAAGGGLSECFAAGAFDTELQAFIETLGIEHLDFSVGLFTWSDETNWQIEIAEMITAVQALKAKSGQGRIEAARLTNAHSLAVPVYEKKQGLSKATRSLLQTSLRCRTCLLYTSPSPRDRTRSRMPSSA